MRSSSYVVLSLAIRIANAQFVCDNGPDALTNALNMSVPQTCFSFDGYERCYYTITPPCVSETPVPLVFDLHGITFCPLRSTLYTGWVQTALEECFVLVYPVGQTDPKVTDNQCWGLPSNNTALDPITGVIDEIENCCCSINGTSVPPPLENDPTFLRAVIEETVENFNREESTLSIDLTRIYMAGHSNGCMASLSMAALHSDVVAAVCCHSGSLVTALASDYQPVPIWMVVGAKDNIVPLKGRKDMFFPAESWMNAVATRNGCDGPEMAVDAGNETMSELRRSNCTNDADVEMVVLPFSGHAPYKGFPEQWGYSGYKNTTADTTTMAWKFCSSHSKSEIPSAFAMSANGKETSAADSSNGEGGPF